VPRRREAASRRVDSVTLSLFYPLTLFGAKRLKIFWGGGQEAGGEVESLLLISCILIS
jgi:hypothetical protein